MKELLLCLCCNGKAEIFKTNYYSHSEYEYKVLCSNCKLCTAEYPTEEQATNAWNRRVK